MQEWWVYMLRCADQTLYTGISTEPARRFHEHNYSPKGARYTRARRPVQPVLLVPAGDRASASRLEAGRLWHSFLYSDMEMRETYEATAEDADQAPAVSFE